MSRELVILWAGRHQRDAWDGLCGRYRERIERFSPVSERVVKGGAGSGLARLREEGLLLREALPDPAWTVALDRRGRQRSSLDLAAWLARVRDEWPHPVVFLLGSDLGLDSALVGECRESLSLGKLTLPHELARLVLYEQLYRALCINSGIKYHREPLQG
jgi:23S rRNA (pseudouridine1915-N3)-methyltransferase